ncbi:MAG: OmpH family outer membrane protein [Thermoguttaceae bacterium]
MIWSVLVASVVLVSISGATAVAQPPAAAPAAAPAALPSLVAVVDLAQLIQNHPDFKGKMEALQNEFRTKEAAFQQRQQEVETKANELKNSVFKPGTPEYLKASDEIASMMGALEADAKKTQREIAIRNSNILFETFQDIKREIAAFANAKGIAQVTDYRQFEVNPNDPQAVSDDMEQKLVWFNSSLEITDVILRQMYQRRGKQYTAAAPTAAPQR